MPLAENQWVLTLEGEGTLRMCFWNEEKRKIRGVGLSLTCPNHPHGSAYCLAGVLSWIGGGAACFPFPVAQSRHQGAFTRDLNSQKRARSSRLRQRSTAEQPALLYSSAM